MAEWIKLSTRTFRDSKVRKLKPLEQLAWVRVLVWCGDEESDGYLEADAPGHAGVTPAQAQALVDVGLLEPDGDGWRVCGWCRWQRTKEQLNAERAAARERRRRTREVKA